VRRSDVQYLLPGDTVGGVLGRGGGGRGWNLVLLVGNYYLRRGIPRPYCTVRGTVDEVVTCVAASSGMNLARQDFCPFVRLETSTAYRYCANLLAVAKP
jgi:hypothetical protein